MPLAHGHINNIVRSLVLRYAAIFNRGFALWRSALTLARALHALDFLYQSVRRGYSRSN